MKNIVTGVVAAGLLAFASGEALSCNMRQLEEDLRWCLDGRDGRGDIAGGAHVKDAAQLERGWNDCDQSDTANHNFGECTAGQKIDTARVILGIPLN
jgi:hypothetical protein